MLKIEKKYDVFISFKNSDNQGNDTFDKEIAYKVYEFLSSKDLKVFFSPITLQLLGRDDWGEEIQKATSLSKIFIALGTQKSYMKAEWTQRERTSFLALKYSDKSKALYSYVALPMVISSLPNDIKGFESFQHDKPNELERLYTYIFNHLENIKKPYVELENTDFVKDVFDGLEQEKLVVLFSQEFSKIDDYYHTIKIKAEKKFEENFYLISIPSFTDNPKRYFQSIAQDCKIENNQVEELQDWKEIMQCKLTESKRDVLLFIIDIEEGNEELDRQFATTIRSLKRDFPHFHALFSGRKSLAKLVYKDGVLSPLNTAKRFFFPDNKLKLDEEQLALQFEMMGKYRKQLCILLQKDISVRYTPWSYDEVINQLFWKNMLIKNGKKFSWRDELTKDVGLDIFSCENTL